MGSATRFPCTPSRTRRAPGTEPGEGSEGEGPREGAAGREAALGFGPSLSRLEDCKGSRGEKLSLCHRSNDGRGPRLTPARRCQRLPGKSPAAEGDALARGPHLHPARRFPPSCYIPRILSEPNDLHTARPSTEVMPALTVGAGAAPLGGGWGARGRLRGERRRRCGSRRSHNEAAGGSAASRTVAPPPIPQDFAPEPAVSARWRRGGEKGRDALEGGA